jgi:4-hydroxy-4-methyl-2-oxoglutarate aldolase
MCGLMRKASVERAKGDLTGQLGTCCSAVIYDVMRDMGLTAAVLPPSIRPLDPTMKVAGPVFTVRGRPDSTVSAHESLLEWTGFLSRAEAGHVVVCQPQDGVRSVMGELSAETLKHRGVLGYVADGGTRDSASIKKIGFPVFCRYSTPIDIVAGWIPEAFDLPIAITNVVVFPGDYIIGDEDGIVIIPGKHAQAVIERAEVAMATENRVRAAILSGTDPQEAYVRYGKF